MSSAASDVYKRKDYNIPVAFDFPAGHGEENFPMIFGREIEFSVKKEGSSIIFSD